MVDRHAGVRALKQRTQRTLNHDLLGTDLGFDSGR
jgi:hypothetical protein